jgi:zinc/manganese transport system substrate-binding protein
MLSTAPLGLFRSASILRLGALLAVMAVLVVAATACADDSNGGGKPPVVATTIQMGALTKAVAGDTVSLTTLVGVGVDPHDYEASASDIKDVSDAKLVIRQGVGIDAFLDKAIEESGQKNIATASDGVPLRRSQNENGQSEDDPHVWHDPTNDKIMIDNIARALSATFPANADTYRANADASKKRFDDVDAQIKALIATLPAESRKMVTDHDAFGYFVDRYGLQLIGTVFPGLANTSEASAKEIADLEDTIRREHVKAIFAESSIDPKVASQVAKDTGVKIVEDLYGDSLGDQGSGADTVDGMLLKNAQSIVNALK